MLIGHLADDSGNQGLPGRNQFIASDSPVDHALNAAFELGGDILSSRRDHLIHRAVVTEQIDNEGVTERLIYGFVCQKISDIEQVARVLPGTHGPLTGTALGQSGHDRKNA
jgi:hypothetical protein